MGSFLGGVCAALGLGGGVVFNPLLLSLDVLPQVVTGTGMYMILFSTFSGTLVYLSIGTLLVKYALLIGFMSTIGIIFALKVVKNVMAKYNRPSIIVFILAGILLVSTIMVPISSTQNLLKAQAAGQDITAFGDMCAA